MSDFEGLKDVTLSKVEQQGNDELHFYSNDGKHWKMHHHQDCCEGVSIEDIVGDLNDLIGSPILHASEETNSGENGSCDSFTWTFYKLRTIKGDVTIRWYGSSNGYYSESVSFDLV